jgi:hypothetical protein
MLLAGLFGVSVSPDLQTAIIGILVGIAGLIGALFPDQIKSHAPDLPPLPTLTAADLISLRRQPVVRTDADADPKPERNEPKFWDGSS